MAYTFSLGHAGQGHRDAATVSRLNPLVPLAKSPPRGYIGYGEAATRVRNQHIPGALSILKGTVPGQVRGPGHMVPTYFRRELRDRAFQRRLRLRAFVSMDRAREAQGLTVQRASLARLYSDQLSTYHRSGSLIGSET